MTTPEVPSTPITDAQLHILRHARGLDQYGQGRWYRNHYVIGANCDGWSDCLALVALGLMTSTRPIEWCGGMVCFRVTEAGDRLIRESSTPAPKLTRSASRYQRWLAADCGMPFREWIKGGH